MLKRWAVLLGGETWDPELTGRAAHACVACTRDPRATIQGDCNGISGSGAGRTLQSPRRGGGVGWGDLLPDHDLHLSDKPAGSGLSIALKVSEYVWVFLPALSENQLMVSSFLQG